MKTLFALLTVIFAGLQGTCQSKIQLNAWFYGFSLEKPLKEIQGSMLADPRFSTIQDQEIIRNPSYADMGYTYDGKLKDPIILNAYPDSVRIKLSFADRKAVKTKRYSGRIKTLRAEYFFTDVAQLRLLYKEAVAQFKENSGKKSRVDTKWFAPDTFGKGLCITYADNSTSFSEVKILVQKSNANILSLWIMYDVSDLPSQLPITLPGEPLIVCK